MNELFDDIFTEAFENTNYLTRGQFRETLEEKLHDDESLREWLMSEFEKLDVDQAGYLTRSEVKQTIVNIFKHEMFLNPSLNQTVHRVQPTILFLNSDYSTLKIKELIYKYQNEFSVQDGNPFEELSNLLDLFFLDSQVNSADAVVRGSDMCELLGLFFDLAEAGQQASQQQISELTKYKTAYNNKLKREKKVGLKDK